jgi:hypothetical protein
MGLPLVAFMRKGRRFTPAEPWLKWAGRFGYAACGIVYVAIGIAAGAVALGLAGEPTGSRGVMLFLSRQPFGPLVLAGLGVGLAGYAALNFAGGFNDPERRGISFRGLVVRAIDILTGALYIALAFAALAIVVDPRDDGISTVTTWAEGILALPFGPVILGLIGAALIVSGGYLFYRASDEPFGEALDKRELSSKTRGWIALAARAGTAARGLIFAICGVFVIRAAMSASPDRVGDVGDALAMIGNAAFGPLLLAVVGAGFIAYGAYQLAKARYQKITSRA